MPTKLLISLFCLFTLSCNQIQDQRNQQAKPEAVIKAKPITLSISGMDCEGCAKSVTKAVSSVEGVESVEVSLENETATLTGTGVDLAKVFMAIDDAGYGATLLDTTLHSSSVDTTKKMQ